MIESGKVTTSRYWHLSFEEKLDVPKNELLALIRSRLGDTVESHLQSDVPIGTFLSGGLDSSMITAIIAQDLGRNLDAVAVGVEEQQIDELPVAKAAADHLGVRLLSKRTDLRISHLSPTSGTIFWSHSTRLA